MSDQEDSGPSRKPRAFRIEDEDSAGGKAERTASGQAGGKTEARTEKRRKPASLPVTVEMTSSRDDPFDAPDAEADALTPPPARPRKRRLTPGKVLLAALGFLAALAIGLWTDMLIRELFDRLPWLGWIALACAGIAALALTALVVREIVGLRRLARVSGLRTEIAARADTANSKEARALASRVASLISANPLSARGRKSLEALEGEIIDGPHYLEFAERELMASLDQQAQQITLNAARRVSVVTAVSPRAFLDLAYVLFEAFRLIRAMAELYGGRPGAVGMVRLFRDVIAHLAVTGAVSAGDSLIQQVVGHGLAARLSARLGEGVVNGLMTARIGISAMDLCRPMPFRALQRPGIGSFIRNIASFAEAEARPGDKAGRE